MGNPYRRIDDGFIKGIVRLHREKCDNCPAIGWSIHMDEVTLPKGITPSSRLIPYRDGANGVEVIDFLGLTCGCYAKAHRQLVHIQERTKK